MKLVGLMFVSFVSEELKCSTMSHGLVQYYMGTHVIQDTFFLGINCPLLKNIVICCSITFSSALCPFKFRRPGPY